MTELWDLAVATAFFDLLRVEHFSGLVLGVLIGLGFGLLPGLGGMSALALVLPMVYGMEPASALALMIGLTSVTNTSDTIPSVLLGIPGTASAQATVLDGYPMARAGEAGRALSAAFAASMLGGIFGAFVLTLAIYAARPLLLLVGFGEQLLLLILSFVLIGTLTGASALKGLTACGIGLLLGSVGTAPATAEHRMDFGMLYFAAGIPLIPVGLGLFALPEIIDGLRFRERIAERIATGGGRLAGLRDVWRHRGLVLRCSMLGSLVGALPGIGGSVIDWLAYGHSVRSAKGPSKFGAGDIRGVIAPESANNAKEGGALIPTLLFGIPGSGTMALLLAGMVLIGVEPGRRMVESELPLTVLVIWSIAVANVLGAGICFALAPSISRVTTVSYSVLAPFLILLLFIAAYQASQEWGDIGTLLAFGTLAHFMKRFGWSRPALLIGFVLSRPLEAAFYRTAQLYGAEFLQRPLTLAVLGFMAFYGLRIWLRQRRAEPGAPLHRGAGLAFAVFLLFLVAVAFYDLHDLSFLGRVFPLSVIGITGLLLITIALRLRFERTPSALHFDLSTEEMRAPNKGQTFVPLALTCLLLTLSALVGFPFAAAIFLLLFLRLIGGARLQYAIFAALVTFGVLQALSAVTRVQYIEKLTPL